MDFDSLFQGISNLNELNSLLQHEEVIPDVPQISESHVLLESTPLEKHGIMDTRREAIDALQSQIIEKERILWINRNLQNKIQDQLSTIQGLLGRRVAEEIEQGLNEEPSEADIHEYSKRVLCSFPVEGSSRYFSRKSRTLLRFVSEDGKPLTLQSPKRSFTAKQWSEKSETMLKELVVEECKQLINMDSVPSDQSANVQAYRAATTPGERSHYLQILIPNLINSFSWEMIASKIGHSQTDCFVHWMNCCDPFVNQNPWTLEEDRKLYMAAEQTKKRYWVKVASEVGNGRVPIQCFQRYIRELEMQGSYKKWTDEEDSILLDTVQKIGTKSWKVVAKKLPERSWDQCRSRYYQALKQRGKKGRWSEMEKCRLLLYLFFYGQDNWSLIAQKMVTRNTAQCRDEWNRCLSPSVSHERWTSKEDKLLLSTVNTKGTTSWIAVSAVLPGRTADACKTRYRLLKKKW